MGWDKDNLREEEEIIIQRQTLTASQKQTDTQQVSKQSPFAPKTFPIVSIAEHNITQLWKEAFVVSLQ